MIFSFYIVLYQTDDEVFKNKQFQDAEVEERAFVEEKDNIKDNHCANEEKKNQQQMM